LITAYSELDYALDAIRNSVVGFVAKPIDAEELLASVVRAGTVAARNRVSGSPRVVRAAMSDTDQESVAALFGIDSFEMFDDAPLTAVGAARLPGADSSAWSVLRDALSIYSYRILQYSDAETVALTTEGTTDVQQIRDSLVSYLGSNQLEREVTMAVVQSEGPFLSSSLAAVLQSCYGQLDHAYFYNKGGVHMVSSTTTVNPGDRTSVSEYPVEAFAALEQALRTGIEQVAAVAQLRHQCRVKEPSPGVVSHELRRVLSRLAVDLDSYELLVWADDLDSCTTHEGLFELLQGLISGHRAGSAVSTRDLPSRIAEAVAYVREHYEDPDLSLSEVAEAASYSPAHLSTLFTRVHGQSFHETLMSERIRAACRLLRSTDLLIYEVADRVGFRNAFHFSTRFKSEMGFTPRQYRSQTTGE
jgi:YesN/AraC family two-component response regulator